MTHDPDDAGPLVRPDPFLVGIMAGGGQAALDAIAASDAEYAAEVARRQTVKKSQVELAAATLSRAMTAGAQHGARIKQSPVHEYVGFRYYMEAQQDGTYRAHPVPGQHHAANRAKHRRAAEETYQP